MPSHRQPSGGTLETGRRSRSLELAQSRGRLGGKPTVFYDPWRVENAKIAEHWDVIQEIPAESMNRNGVL